MSDDRPPVGSIAWTDLTVAGADGVRDFYAAVVGWAPAPVDMGGYSDYNMTDPDSGEPRAGICHARGDNRGLPPQWLNYLVVADLDASMAICRELGGEVLAGPRGQPGGDRYCVIRDPAGAVAALYQIGD
ncbi:MAG: VOC family protein [Thermoanaerobaculia bacterium]|nr:VOC family protein [Thermoanaerobaculia bacterium]